MDTRRKYTELDAKTYQKLVRSESKLTPSPWALDHVRYVSTGGVRRIELSFPESNSILSLMVPVKNIRELESATVKDLRELRLSPARDTIISDALDAHISVEGLVRDIHQSNTAFNRIVATLWEARDERGARHEKHMASN
jgi:hypothetical protein